nr:hypothetical protein [Tanacetum cinerariifolium]
MKPTVILRKKFILSRKLLYDNSSPRHPKEINSKNSDAVIESFSLYPIPVKDSDPYMEEINLFLTSDGLIPPRSEDIFFDPRISNYHFSSLEPDVSHRSGTFMKFNVYPNHLNEIPMEILSSTCFPMDQ